ncbi:MAG: PadR family transcriptional regulator [Ilumatobacteraceae bacterium]
MTPRRSRSGGRTGTAELLLGEWACLGVLAPSPTHGFAIAAQLTPETEVGRIWSLSRPLTYRAIAQLTARALVRPVADEPGAAGPNRTILAATDHGRAELRAWLETPVTHLRDLRSELLMKIVLAERNDIDLTDMLGDQRRRVAEQEVALSSRRSSGEVVDLWRHEVSIAGLRFLDRLTESGHRRRLTD